MAIWLTATALMLTLATGLTWLLVVASARLAVPEDPLQQALASLLPQANCGGCGYPSCAAYARALAAGEASADRCSVGGPDVASGLAQRLGISLQPSYPVRPVIHCGAHTEDRLQRGEYVGPASCAAAATLGGVQGCTYGCLGFGDCVQACEYQAMELDAGLPRVLYEHCIGCGACVKACPRSLIEQVPFVTPRMLVVACASHDPGKVVRQVCRVGCVGCGACARLEPELFTIEDNLAQLRGGAVVEPGRLQQVIDKCPMESLVEMGPPPAPEDADRPPGVAARPAIPQRPTAEDMVWRG